MYYLNFTSKQINFLEMGGSCSLLLKMNEITHTQFIKIYRGPLVRIPVWGRGKSGKTPGWEQAHKQLIKYFGRIPNRRRELSRKLLPANRTTNGFKRILWEFHTGKGNIRENSSLHKRNIFPGKWVWWHPGWEPVKGLGLFYSAAQQRRIF
jgi:hypothetical protein